MLRLDFDFSDDRNESIELPDLGHLSEVDLRYGSALGSLIFVVNGVDCSVRWGWIPLIDLAVALHDIREELAGKSSGKEVFEFTESDATVTIQRNRDVVRLITNYVPCSECVPFAEFDKKVSLFRDKVFREAVARFPSLEENTEFRSLRERTEAGKEVTIRGDC